MLPALGGDLFVSFQARSKASNVASVEFGRLGQLGPLLLFLLQIQIQSFPHSHLSKSPRPGFACLPSIPLKSAVQLQPSC